MQVYLVDSGDAETPVPSALGGKTQVPHLKAWPFREGLLIVIPVLSMGQTWLRKYTSLGRRTQPEHRLSVGVPTDPASRIGLWGLGEQSTAPSFPNGIVGPGQGRKQIRVQRPGKVERMSCFSGDHQGDGLQPLRGWRSWEHLFYTLILERKTVQ